MEKTKRETTTHPSKGREIKIIKHQMLQVTEWIKQIHENHKAVKDEKVYKLNLAAANEKMEEHKMKLDKLMNEK